MAVNETTKKQGRKPLTGAEGNTFTKDNQPSPKSKSEGWKKLRAQRLLTQEIIKALTKDDNANLKSYVSSLIVNAKSGNSKAIETLNKCMEDDIIKVAQTDSEGNDVDLSRYTEEELRTIAALQRKSGVSEA